MKDRTVAIILALFLGGIGVHKFYLGRTGPGLMYLLFCWTLIPSLLALVDVFTLAFMEPAAFDAQYNALALPSAGAPAAPQQIAQSVVVEAPPLSLADELSGLHALKEEGILSQEEFDAQKRRLLERS